MNTSIQWLYQQSHGAIPRGDQKCYLCGLPCSERYTVAKGLADTFNSHYLALCPSSLYLCVACQWYFDNKAGHPEFRKMSLIVESTCWIGWLREDMKDDIEQALRHGVQEDCYFVVSLSKKKHILLQAPMNAKGTYELAIQVEEQAAHVTLAIWEMIEAPFMSLLRLGHGKGEILSGNLYGQTLKKHGQLVHALRWNDQLAQWRDSALLELYSYVTIVEREITGDGAGGSVSARIGDTTGSVHAVTSNLEWDRQRVPEQVPHGDMAHVRGESSDSGQDYEQLDLFSL